MEVRKGFKQTGVGSIPDDWDIKPLGYLFEITSSKRVFQSEWKNEGVPFYRARELAVLGEKGFVQNDLFISKGMYEAFKKQYGVPKIGDILVTGVGTLGKVYVVPDDSEFYFKDGNIIWFKISGKVSSEYLKQLYSTHIIIKQIEDASAGTTVGTYTITGAKKTIIPFPLLKEQASIAKALGDADAFIEALEQLLTKKRQIKQGAMQELLTGKRRLPEFAEDWKVFELKEIVTNFIVPMRDKPKTFKGEVPWCRIEDFDGKMLLGSKSNQCVDNEIIKQMNLKVHPIGTLLVSCSADLGRCAIVGKPLVSNQTFIGLVFDGNKASNDYFYYYMTYHAEELNNLSSGTTISYLSREQFEAFKVKAPPTKLEQTAIAEILSDMDTEITMLEDKLAKARQIKQGMLQELLTGRIRLI